MKPGLADPPARRVLATVAQVARETRLKRVPQRAEKLALAAYRHSMAVAVWREARVGLSPQANLLILQDAIELMR